MFPYHLRCDFPLRLYFRKKPKIEKFDFKVNIHGWRASRGKVLNNFEHFSDMFKDILGLLRILGLGDFKILKFSTIFRDSARFLRI